MLEMNFNPQEIESFIKSYYQEFKDINVTVSFANGSALVKSDEEQINLSPNDISFVISEYFASQNLGISNFNISGGKESTTFIKFTQLTPELVKRAA